uniref:Sushi domain-containing protein n=1 Tax=Falco tinnunculus TaxID=100819 RepID=A0A8C4XK73_FALTI
GRGRLHLRLGPLAGWGVLHLLHHGRRGCSYPPAITNGKHSGQATAVFVSGMSVSYTCDPGYVLVGEAQLNCTSSGAWSVPAPQCEERLCPSPSPIDHGQHDGKDVKVFVPGKSVNYSCDPGYSLIGETALYCTVNGTWSIPYPRCEASLFPGVQVHSGSKMGLVDSLGISAIESCRTCPFLYCFQHFESFSPSPLFSVLLVNSHLCILNIHFKTTLFI